MRDSRKLLQVADVVDPDPYRGLIRKALDSREPSGYLQTLRALATDAHADSCRQRARPCSQAHWQGRAICLPRSCFSRRPSSAIRRISG